MTTAASTPAETAGSSRPCNRCKDHEGTIDLRGAETVCKTCFAYYVSSKAIKRLEALQRETAAPRPSNNKVGPTTRRPQQRYLVGLSCGPSSTALLHVLTENVRQQRARGQKTSRFEYVAVHVVDDTTIPSSSSTVRGGRRDGDGDGEGNREGDEDEDPYIAAFRTRFPDANLQTVPLSSALDLPSIDWTSLPTPTPTPQDSSPSPSHRLSQILQSLPSTTSRADIHRLLVRHVLLATSLAQSCDALLLGHSTTSLAELTLSETAKGRGFALPWLVNDGAVPVPSSLNHGFPAGFPSDATNNNNNNNIASTNGIPTQTARHLPIYSPLRELFRKELVLYISQASPPLIGLLPPVEAAKISSAATNGSGGVGVGGAVVSHRDLSIDDVLGRYFGEVEASYPSVVANVVRTTGKLLRRPVDADHDHHDYEGNITSSNATNCGLCGAPVDELGDERWRGEIGDDDDDDGNGDRAGTRRKLCYGCQRSIRQ
ncbi:hypothetical protein F5Y00DRAFT_229283 [Daldinia vernicosa]|uniref:uncharacterized protein n=1 Tax=Daldinia vernicosa TaxID=114800 RepID=UPI002008DABA|nr:uncharacterized protein F5Y00DRAFT_229283 [Daldinia vernicosa]KAI0851799.1 hypothetical protein F5Y00DRAFT_229283 [Daldinia vernicosa]